MKNIMKNRFIIFPVMCILLFLLCTSPEIRETTENSGGMIRAARLFNAAGASRHIAKTIVVTQLEQESDLEMNHSEKVKSSGLGRRYNATEEEFRQLCFRTYAEAANQGFEGQLYVACCAINYAINHGITLQEEMNLKNRYECVENGIVYMGPEEHKEQVTDEMITEELVQAVEIALMQDYTEPILKEIALNAGLDAKYYEGGAMYFHSPKSLSPKAKAARENLKVVFQYRDHVFFRYWDK